MIQLLTNKLTSTAILPKKAHSDTIFEDAGFDLFACSPESITLMPNERKIVDTGIRILIPSGYWIKFHERSGNAAKFGLHVLAGVIDNSYTGEFKVVLYNSGTSAITIDRGKAVAQFTLEKLTDATINEIEDSEFIELSESRTRKANGFGSSDAKKEAN